MTNFEINKLIAELDFETAKKYKSNKKLYLVGDSNKSPFLRAVMRKAKLLGIKCDCYEYIPGTVLPTDSKDGIAVVFDKETCPSQFSLLRWEDIDNIQHPGMSSVSEAIWLLLDRLNLVSGKDITIVGRGHSVKELADTLVSHDATVTVAHSKTKYLLKATMFKDVVIYATPEINKVIAYNTEKLVIDIGNCIKHPDWFNCEYINGIGKLTVSVLLNRLVR